MNLVYYQKRRRYQTFRRLPRGADYWLATNTATAPFVKYNEGNRLNGWSASGAATLSAISDRSVTCVRVPETFLSQNRSNG